MLLKYIHVINQLMFCKRHATIFGSTRFRLSPRHFRWMSAWSSEPDQQTIDKHTYSTQTTSQINTSSPCLLPGNPPVSRTCRLQRPQIRCAPTARRTGANALHSYNRYLTVASRVVRRSLKDDKRLAAERRGESDLRFAKWEVRIPE